MRRQAPWIIAAGTVALAATIPEVRAAGLDLAGAVHGAFVVVFVDAANFVAGCF